MNGSQLVSGLVGFCLFSLPWWAAAQGDWSEVNCVPADLPPEVMYRTVDKVDAFSERSMQWTPMLGSQNARCSLHFDPSSGHTGPGSLRVDYTFTGRASHEYVQLGMPLRVPDPGVAIGFWMKCDQEFPVRVRVLDKSGETHQFEVMLGAPASWRFAVAALEGPSTSWGGDGNRRCDFPCRLEGIVFDKVQREFRGTGSLWLDDVSLLRAQSNQRTLKVAARSARFGNLYAVGETVAVRFQGRGDEIRWVWEDYWEQALVSGMGPATGSVAQFKVPGPGFYACRCNLYDRGQLVEVQRYCCAALRGGAESARSDFVGVCSHFGQQNYPLPSMDLMRAYGIDQFRDEISWRSVERQRGVYALPKHAKDYLRHAAALDMRPLIIYDYSNPLYDQGGFPNSTEAIDAFAAYAVNLTRQTEGRVAMFEIWNEWIGGCGMKEQPGEHGPREYGRLQRATYAAVKKAFPDVTVVGIGGEYGVDCAEKVIAALQEAGPDTMDGWSIHPYRYPRAPEVSELAGEVQRIAERVRSIGADQPVWITEIGWPTHVMSRGSTEAMQARYCVRALVLLQSTGVVEKVFWYDFKDDGKLRGYNEHNFGLVRHQDYSCAPKPAVVALSTFIRVVGAARFQNLDVQGPARLARYELSDGRELVIAWSAESDRTVKISGHVEQVIDIMGADMRGSLPQQLTSDPIYLVGRGLKLDVE